jgi:hypothetical protein
MKPAIECEKEGGRNKASDATPALVEAIKDVVSDHTAGSPVDASLRWTNRSPREIAEEIAGRGFSACTDTVRLILTETLGLRRRKACKDEAGGDFEFRDQQFEHIAALRTLYIKQGSPIISIDTKKKELLGNFFRAGTAYTDGRIHVADHDFAPKNSLRAIPFGVYDLQRNEGFVLLASGADNGELACHAIERWWLRMGQRHYSSKGPLLVLCDCGGGNANRSWRFKEDLAWLATRLQRILTIAHYPPYCSKYNPIEHRLFPHVTRAMQGIVLKTMNVVRDCIARTSTATGLRVLVETTHKIYEKARPTTARFRERMPLIFEHILPTLNYKIRPMFVRP